MGIRDVSPCPLLPPLTFTHLAPTRIIGFVNARHADKSGERFLHVTIPLFIGLIGFVIAIATMNIAARYISLFLVRPSPPHSLSSYVPTFFFLSLNRSRTDGPSIRRINRFTLLGFQFDPPPTRKTCCRLGVYKCVFAVGKYRGIVCVAEELGANCESAFHFGGAGAEMEGG
jgi:hypothetical protein